MCLLAITIYCRHRCLFLLVFLSGVLGSRRVFILRNSIARKDVESIGEPLYYSARFPKSKSVERCCAAALCSFTFIFITTIAFEIDAMERIKKLNVFVSFYFVKMYPILYTRTLGVF